MVIILSMHHIFESSPLLCIGVISNYYLKKYHVECKTSSCSYVSSHQSLSETCYSFTENIL